MSNERGRPPPTAETVALSVVVFRGEVFRGEVVGHGSMSTVSRALSALDSICATAVMQKLSAPAKVGADTVTL